MRLYFTLKMALNALRHNVMRVPDHIGYNYRRRGGDYDDGDRQRRLLSHTARNGSIGANTVIVLPGSTNIAAWPPVQDQR